MAIDGSSGDPGFVWVKLVVLFAAFVLLAVNKLLVVVVLAVADDESDFGVRAKNGIFD